MADFLQIASITQDELADLLRSVVREELAALEPEKNPLKYYTRDEVCEKLRITKPTLDAYSERGLIEKTRFGRRVLYSAAAIDKALAEIPSMKYKRR